MTVYNLSESNTVLNHFLAQLRDVDIQKDSMRFRKNLQRIGEIMAYEISKTLAYKATQITTPMGVKDTFLLNDKIVLCPVLRAGLALHEGFLSYFDDAESGFISAYRHHPNNDDYFDIVIQYRAAPSLNNKTLILIDPMLATGLSLEAVFKKLMDTEKPKAIHIAVAIASPEGVAYLQQHLPDNCHLWIAALDEKLNDKKYIIPGLGDAGDLAYGSKL